MIGERRTIETRERGITAGSLLVIVAGIYVLAHGAPVASAVATGVLVLAWVGAGMVAVATVAVAVVAVTRARARELAARPRVMLEDEIHYDDGSIYARRASWPAGSDPCLPPSPVVRVDWLGRRRPIDTQAKELEP